MQAFQGPASQASTTMLVPNSFISRAAGLNQSIISLMTIAAAPVGALAIGAFGTHRALMIDVVTAIAGIVPLLFYSIPQPERENPKSSPWTDFIDGVGFVWKSIALRHLFYIQGAVILFLMPCFTLVPLLVTEHFHGTVNDVAIMEGLAGFGMLIGAGIAAYMNVRKRALTLVFGLSLSCLAIGFTALAPRNAFPVAVAFWFISGVSYTFGNSPMTAILQTAVPRAMQGRIFSLMAVVMGFASPVGLSLLGPAGSIIGVRGLFIAGGFIAGILVLLGLFSKNLFTLDKKQGATAPSEKT